MAEHKEESVMDKITEKFHRGSSSSSSSSDDEGKSGSSSSVKAKIYRLFGREKPVHSVLGGGKPADLFLWRNKKISGGVLAGATAIWLLFEAEQRVGEQNQAMASKSRPSQRPTCTTRRMMASSPTPAPSSPTPSCAPVHDSALTLLLLLPTVAVVLLFAMVVCC